GTPVPKIIDFGIAKALGQQLTDKTLYTGFAQMIGTPLYMSPEQAAFSGLDVDTRSVAPPQRLAVEETQGAHRLVELAPRHLAFQQVQLKGTHPLRSQQVRRPPEMLGEPGHMGHVNLDGPRRVVAQPQIIHQPLP